MADPESFPLDGGVQAALFFETPEEIYARVFRELKPRTPPPQMRVEFCPFANPDSFIRLENGRLHVRISDLLAGAPAPVTEALAHILLRKLYRKSVPRMYTHRYRLYLNRRDVRTATWTACLNNSTDSSSMACWRGPNWAGAAGCPGRCWAISIPPTTPS